MIRSDETVEAQSRFTRSAESDAKCAEIVP